MNKEDTDMWTTRVRAPGGSGETVSVEFNRTDGASVQVTLKSVGAADPVAMAQIIMAEAAEHTSSAPGNASSTVPAEAQPAPGYTLEYRDERAIRTLEGIDLPSLEAARAEALRSASDLVRAGDERDPEDWAVRVRDATGTIVVSINWRQARDCLKKDVY